MIEKLAPGVMRRLRGHTVVFEGPEAVHGNNAVIRPDVRVVKAHRHLTESTRRQLARVHRLSTASAGFVPHGVLGSRRDGSRVHPGLKMTLGTAGPCPAAAAVVEVKVSLPSSRGAKDAQAGWWVRGRCGRRGGDLATGGRLWAETAVGTAAEVAVVVTAPCVAQGRRWEEGEWTRV